MKNFTLPLILIAFLFAGFGFSGQAVNPDQFSDSFFEQGTDDSFTVNVFPNPNNGVFEIRTNGKSGQGMEAVIFNVIGERVFHKKLEGMNEKVDVTHLEKGLYMIQVYNKEYNQKIIKRFYIE